MQYILHLGLSKTGTTSLQQHFFPRLPNVELAERGGAGLAAALAKIRYRHADAIKLPKGEAGYLESLRRNFLSFGAHSPSTHTTVVSNENVIGPHPDGVGTLVARVKSVCPAARIIVALREPNDFLRSLYRQEIENGFSCLKKGEPYGELGNYEAYIRRALNKGPAGPLGFLYYNDLIAALKLHFGNADLLLLNFNDMRRDEIAYLRRISDFIGVTLETIAPLELENVSERKIVELLADLVALGGAPQELVTIEQAWTRMELEAETEEALSRFVADHASTFLSL